MRPSGARGNVDSSIAFVPAARYSALCKAAFQARASTHRSQQAPQPPLVPCSTAASRTRSPLHVDTKITLLPAMEAAIKAGTATLHEHYALALVNCWSPEDALQIHYNANHLSSKSAEPLKMANVRDEQLAANQAPPVAFTPFLASSPRPSENFIQARPASRPGPSSRWENPVRRPTTATPLCSLISWLRRASNPSSPCRRRRAPC